ncbi:hypothetical protein EVAR_55138_1 [Eumeta japonica]|uniref:Uncharacterized protein n=1 Tax=Eumeta variegata TaxID=151549 RepID=A0A4C1YBH5_EUMVA|nr:hypothetical protein EVAR_55138_1 [Eumeta japonica]
MAEEALEVLVQIFEELRPCAQIGSADEHRHRRDVYSEAGGVPCSPRRRARRFTSIYVKNLSVNTLVGRIEPVPFSSEVLNHRATIAAFSYPCAISTVQQTKLCRCEISHDGVAIA